MWINFTQIEDILSKIWQICSLKFLKKLKAIVKFWFFEGIKLLYLITVFDLKTFVTNFRELNLMISLKINVLKVPIFNKLNRLYGAN